MYLFEIRVGGKRRSLFVSWCACVFSFQILIEIEFSKSFSWKQSRSVRLLGNNNLSIKLIKSDGKLKCDCKSVLFTCSILIADIIKIVSHFAENENCVQNYK